MWRNPKQTGLIVGGASLAYFLLSSGTSTSFVVSVLVLAVVAIATLWGQTGSLFKRLVSFGAARILHWLLTHMLIRIGVPPSLGQAL